MVSTHVKALRWSNFFESLQKMVSTHVKALRWSNFFESLQKMVSTHVKALRWSNFFESLHYFDDNNLLSIPSERPYNVKYIPFKVESYHLVKGSQLVSKVHSLSALITCTVKVSFLVEYLIISSILPRCFSLKR